MPPQAASIGEWNDAALVTACLAGEERAWQELVRRYGRLVYSIPRRMGMSDADADDVFQNVFASVLRALPGLQDQTRLSAWLITTTRRECWKVAGRNRGHADLDGLAEVLPAIDDGPVADIERLEREQAVRSALARLDEKCRNLLTALFLLPDGQPPYEEIAARLGMAIGSIGPTRARCFRKLEPILAEYGLDAAGEG
ncbi:MAG: RNA polymerase sigma factor [Chloroflexota bacterium]